MAGNWRHWCRKGCGKKVVYIDGDTNNLRGYRFKCHTCGETYKDKVEVDNVRF